MVGQHWWQVAREVTNLVAEVEVPLGTKGWFLYLLCKYATLEYPMPMDRVFEHGGNTFVWDEEKAAENLEEHGVAFEEAVTVFDDPLFRIKDATRNEEARDAAIGFSSAARLLTVVHLEIDGEFIRIISAWRASAAEEALYAE